MISEPAPVPGVIEHLTAERERMVEAIRDIVEHESPTDEHDLVSECIETVARWIELVLGSRANRVVRDGRTHLVWESPSPQIVVLCHLDTVWPRGTIRRWSFGIEGGIATGPGIFDMKAGLVQGLFAIAASGCATGVRLLVTSDEEIGSPTGRGLIEESVRGMRAALVMEPSYAGALKIARKSVALYTVRVHGKAVHASEPELGANAGLEMAHQMIAVAALGAPEEGTTVTPTLSQSGTTANTVPSAAEFRVDSRAVTGAEAQRVDAGMHSLRPVVRGTRVSVEGGVNRPPLTQDSTRGLFARAEALAPLAGISDLRGVLAPGGSDGQFAAHAGAPTLDGLGAVGGNAHAEGEWIDLGALVPRTALVALLLRDLVGRPTPA